MNLVRHYGRMYPVVVPLRHPVAVALSWWIRMGKGFDGFRTEWTNMTKLSKELEMFFFPIETKPFDELEKFLGREVTRIDTREGGKGPYTERDQWESGDIESLKAGPASHVYEMGMDWVKQDEIASRFYGLEGDGQKGRKGRERRFQAQVPD